MPKVPAISNRIFQGLESLRCRLQFLPFFSTELQAILVAISLVPCDHFKSRHLATILGEGLSLNFEKCSKILQ